MSKKLTSTALPDAKKSKFYKTVSRFPERKVFGKPVINISKNLKAQIDYLHGKFPGVEWSGFLLFSIDKGSMEAPADMEFTAKYIFPCDVGSAAYTEYSPSDYVVDMDKETEFLVNDWKLGHIHTHHSMDAFFSGTDQDELHTNVESYKDMFYLSLIVNHSGKYCAKIAFLVETEESISYRTALWRSPQKRTEMAYLDCDIKFEKDIIDMTEGFLAQIENIKPKPKVYTNTAWNGANWASGKYSKTGSSFSSKSSTSTEETSEETVEDARGHAFICDWIVGSNVHGYKDARKCILAFQNEIGKPSWRDATEFATEWLLEEFTGHNLAATHASAHLTNEEVSSFNAICIEAGKVLSKLKFGKKTKANTLKNFLAKTILSQLEIYDEYKK